MAHTASTAVPPQLFQHGVGLTGRWPDGCSQVGVGTFSDPAAVFKTDVATSCGNLGDMQAFRAARPTLKADIQTCLISCAIEGPSTNANTSTHTHC